MALIVQQVYYGILCDGVVVFSGEDGVGMEDAGSGDGLCVWVKSVKVDVCSHVGIWIIFWIFCFVMGEL